MESRMLQCTPDAGRGTAFYTYLLCCNCTACTTGFGLVGMVWVGFFLLT